MMMKSIFALAAFAAGAFAQSITIASPPTLATVHAGQTFLVEIARPNTLSPSQEVSVVIGVNPCRGNDCTVVASSGVMGTILYAGPYNPSHHPGTPADQTEYYQNFTLELPSGFAQGPAVLSVAHLSLVGAGPFPFLEQKNSTIYVV